MILAIIISLCAYTLAFIYGKRAEYVTSRGHEMEAFCNMVMCLAFIIVGSLSPLAFLIAGAQ